MKLTRTATVSVKVEQRVKRKGRWVWKLITVRVARTATASGRTLTVRAPRGRSLARGSYRVDRDRRRQEQDAQLPRVSGVLALGDSITNGGGELQWGVALQSWALWVARGLGLPFTTYAVDGARTADVARVQVPAISERSARPDARYDLGCLYAGRQRRARAGLGPGRLRRRLRGRVRRAGGALRARAGGDDPARPGPPARRRRRRAGQRGDRGAHDALVLDLRGFGARNLVMTDHVHPTAFGQVWIAERALDVLAADGMDVRVRPSTLIAPGERTRLRSLQGDWTYVYRALKESVGCRGSGAPSWRSRCGT